jgi:hypothetical protein
MNINIGHTRRDRRSTEVRTAEGYTSIPGAQHLGTALLALTELVTHIETGFRRGTIHRYVADRLAVDIDRLGEALNALVPRPS